MRRPLAAATLAATLILCAAASASAQDLQPPPPMATSPAYTPTVNTSDESEDSGLGLEWVYLNADAGFAYTNMASFSQTNLAVQEAASSGAALGIGAGVRVLFLTLGARARDLQLSSFNLWELDGEAAFHIRIWRIDPYFGVRGGYAFVGSLGSAPGLGSASSDVAVHGVNVGPMFGIDVYVTNYFSIGAEANAEFLLLKRPPVALPAAVVSMLSPSQQQLYQESGSSVGFGAIATAHLGLHF